jgi:hypothetical protein
MPAKLPPPVQVSLTGKVKLRDAKSQPLIVTDMDRTLDRIFFLCE